MRHPIKKNIILSAVTGCAFGMAVSANAQNMQFGQNMQAAQPAAANAPVSFKLDPSKGSPFNNGIFEGWGTSLCWWANRVGYDDKLTDDCVDLFFDTNKGLMMNIARYNIGGGDDPTHTHITRSDSNMPGFAQPCLDENGNFEVDADGLVIYRYDWTKDANQMNVLRKILARNKDLQIEAFSNSPPYFMTWSGCSCGGKDDHRDNLNPKYNDMFAEFLADVVYQFRKVWKIELNSIEPMNEPSSRYWNYFSNKQEGCDFKDPAAQNAILLSLDKALRKKGVREGIRIAASDETSTDLLEPVYNSMKPETKKAIDRINIHTYGGRDKAGAGRFAASTGKQLWMSEVDGGGTIGRNAGEMGGALWLAKQITDDLNGLQASAWVLWQVVASYYDGVKDRFRPSLAGGYWGLSYSDHTTSKVVLGKKYYACGQYTRYIRPGDRVIASSRKTLAAYNKENGKIVIAVYNETNANQEYTIDLSLFDKIPSTKARVFTTSGRVNGGENWAEGTPVALDGKNLKFTVAPLSIATYVIPGTGAGTELPK